MVNSIRQLGDNACYFRFKSVAAFGVVNDRLDCQLDLQVSIFIDRQHIIAYYTRPRAIETHRSVYSGEKKPKLRKNSPTPVKHGHLFLLASTQRSTAVSHT